MKRNLAQILAMESAPVTENKVIKSLLFGQRKNYLIAQESIFDFFRKNEDKENKKKSSDPKEHLTELDEANKVSVHLYTKNVDTEIEFLEELISKGLPFFRKDYDRLSKTFKFVIDNNKDILEKVDKLVDIFLSDKNCKMDKSGTNVDFSSFIIISDGYGSSKEQLLSPGYDWNYIDTDNEFSDVDEFDGTLSLYKRLYGLNGAVPQLVYPVPKQKASKDQTRVYLSKNDPKLQKLLKLNMELIEKGKKTVSEEDRKKLIELAVRADELTLPKIIGDGTDYGMTRIVSGSHYQYYLSKGYSESFVKNYTAH